MEVYCFSTSLGNITLCSEDGSLTALHFEESEKRHTKEPILLCAEKQIQEYLSGKRKNFELALKFYGTDFQAAVWKAASEIPYGSTQSYHDIALAVGHPKADRAVGTALGKNPLPLLIPCHRVIRKDGSPGNYGYGEAMKRKLLRLEKKYGKNAV